MHLYLSSFQIGGRSKELLSLMSHPRALVIANAKHFGMGRLRLYTLANKRLRTDIFAARPSLEKCSNCEGVGNG